MTVTQVGLDRFRKTRVLVVLVLLVFLMRVKSLMCV